MNRRHALALTTSIALLAGIPGAGAATAPDGKPSATPGSALRKQFDGQTSDGLAGRTAPRQPLYAGVRRTVLAERQVTPGVRYVRFDQTDARGTIQAHLLRIDYRTRGLTVDQASTRKVAETAPLPDIVRGNKRTVAAVNGDFFDIGRSGAPLGVGLDRQRRLLHGPTSGWNSAFFVGRRGMPQIGSLPVRVRLKQWRKLSISSFNSPLVADNTVGAYNQAWSRRTPGYRITNGRSGRIRAVVVRKGKVVWNKPRLPRRQKLRGWMLVGRGSEAPKLKRLAVGRRANIAAWVPGAPQTAITGNRFILLGGESQVVDDVEMHPRTAIGIDRDAKQLLVLVIDGRSRASRGYTMVELASIFRDLGAEDALNLDGGGSSTMMVRGPGGRLRVVNTPSDGQPRSVPNGLEIIDRRR